MSTSEKGLTRRNLLKGILAAGAAPLLIPASAMGAAGRPAPSNRLAMGCIGIGGQGGGDMQGFLGFSEVQVVAVCDVARSRREGAKRSVDQRYGGAGCAATADFREVVGRPDIDLVMIATPDHWHATIAVAALRGGKDVYCEKPESLTIREGRIMVETARRYGRVFSGGSQRVWGDYTWFHRMVRGGAIGEVQEVWVDVGDPSRECNLGSAPVPPDLDWDMWLGPAPWAPYHPDRCSAAYGGGSGFRAWRDYSGGMMTDWGAHHFGGALFACNLHRTGPVEIIPPNGRDVRQLTYVFASGIRIHKNGGWSGPFSMRGTKGEIPARGGRGPAQPPDVFIQNYRGQGGIQGDFLYCVRTRERPFRDIEVAHRTASFCHLGNIAWWLGRPLKWDPVKEEFVGDAEANRWLDRPKRAPWHLE